MNSRVEASPRTRKMPEEHPRKPGTPGRDRLPAGRWAAVMNADQAISGLTAGAVLVVAAIAAVVSFVHIEHLAVMNGQTSVAAILLPLSIDDTVAASLFMLRAARAGLGTPRRAGVALERASGSPVPPGGRHRSSGIAVLKGTGIKRADAGIPGTGRPGAWPGPAS
jgi:Protein of unknown function (DUF2637)